MTELRARGLPVDELFRQVSSELGISAATVREIHYSGVEKLIHDLSDVSKKFDELTERAKTRLLKS